LKKRPTDRVRSMKGPLLFGIIFRVVVIICIYDAVNHLFDVFVVAPNLFRWLTIGISVQRSAVHRMTIGLK